MSHIKYLSLNSFRVFKNNTKLEICPITFLTGPNSSGKSSVLKSLLLLKNNCNNDLQVLDFSGPKHNLGSFDNSINNKQIEKGIIGFGLEASITDEGIMASFIKEPIATKRSIYYVLKEIESATRTDIYIELTYSQNERSGKLNSIECFLKNDNLSFMKLSLGNSENEFHNLKIDYAKISKNKLLKTIFIDEVLRYDYTIKAKKKVLNYRIDTHFSYQNNVNKQYYNEPTLIFGKLYEKFINENVVFKMQREVHNYLISYPLKRLLKDFSNIIENTEYLEAVRANTKRLYTNDSQGTSFNDLILDYKSREISDESIEFTNYWLKKFDIADSIEFNNVEGVATTIYLVKNGNRIALADLGYGITQFLPILLKIALEEPIRKIKDENLKIVKKLILLEEPETNLHPKLQSMIADFLLDSINKFEIRFIIETHSEYLIRKTQLLVAENKINKNNVVIYYFNPPESESDNIVERIDINENGSLSNQFGVGFFDEATSLKLELLKKKKI